MPLFFWPGRKSPAWRVADPEPCDWSASFPACGWFGHPCPSPDCISFKVLREFSLGKPKVWPCPLPPHPGPLPWGEGASFAVAVKIRAAGFAQRAAESPTRCRRDSFSPGEKVRMRGKVACRFKAPAHCGNLVPPHPGPLPWGEGGDSPAPTQCGCERGCPPKSARNKSHSTNREQGCSRNPPARKPALRACSRRPFDDLAQRGDGFEAGEFFQFFHGRFAAAHVLEARFIGFVVGHALHG